jgi:hypothetical protein
MTKNDSNVIHIASKPQAKTASAAQKQFNTLIKKIDGQKKLLLEWKATIPAYQQKVDQEYEPLFDSFNEHRLQWIQLLDSYYDQPAFKKTDKVKIKHLIASVCDDLIVDMEDNENVKALFNKYNDEDYDTANSEKDALVADMMKDIVKNMFNVDIGDDVDVSSPEKFRAHLEEKMREKDEMQEQEPPAAETIKQPKKSKKQLEKEARQKQDEELASKSLQEIYRKLVAVLHPDREPDEQERQRKTELMQRVNTAYGKKDLLQLLELQLEIEQIDAKHLSQIADSRLKHFNKILKEQLSELMQETNQLEEAFKFQLQMPFYARLTPKQLLFRIAEDTKVIKNDIVSIKKDLKQLADATVFKIWLKSYKIPRKNDFDDDFDDIFFGSPFKF